MPKLKDLPLSQFNVWQRYFSKEKCFDTLLSIIYKKLPLFHLSTMT